MSNESTVDFEIDLQVEKDLQMQPFQVSGAVVFEDLILSTKE